MATAHTLYENKVLENKITDLVNTKLETRSLMTMDYSLAESAGLKKVVNKYTYTGKVEKLAKAAKNTTKGKVTFTPVEYVVNRYQQTYDYNDMDVMQDPMVVDVAPAGAATLMANQIKEEYFAELAKISNSHTYDNGTSPNYDTIVDALATLDQEVEDGMFILMGNDMRAVFRKDADYKASRQGEILYTGQFGTICGLPCLFSKLVPAKTIYVSHREAVHFLVKKEGTVEQDRDIETKDNTVVYERHGLIALMDETKSVKITEAAASGG